MFFNIVATEEDPNKVKVLNWGPGVMPTGLSTLKSVFSFEKSFGIFLKLLFGIDRNRYLSFFDMNNYDSHIVDMQKELQDFGGFSFG